MFLRLLLPAALSLNLFAACAVASETVAEPGLKRVWMVSEWPGFERTQLIARRAHIDLTALPRGRVDMGCNQLGIQVAVRNPRHAEGRLDIRTVAATRMHCRGRMDLEQAFVRQIGRFQRYRLAGHRLTLEDAAGQTVQLVAQDWD